MASDWSSSYGLLDDDPYALGAADHDPYAHDPYAQGAAAADVYATASAPPSRVDAWDAQAYTTAQFSQFSEGLNNEWHAVAPAVHCENGEGYGSGHDHDEPQKRVGSSLGRAAGAPERDGGRDKQS